MVARRSTEDRLKNVGRLAVAVALCGLLVEQPLLAEPAISASGYAPTQSQPQIGGQERVLHALNRLTFGPRPGDVATVEKMGLNAWFEQQLNPATIDDSALDARLAQYPAMNLSIAQLEERYPGPQIIRQMIAGKIGLPSDPTERLMAEDQIAFYKMKKAEQAAKVPEAVAAPAMQTGQATAADEEKAAAQVDLAQDEMANSASDQGSPSERMARHQAALRILELPPEQRYQAILGMKPQELVQFRQSLKGAEVVRIADGMTPQQTETLLALPGSLRMVALEAMESRLERDIYSNRQLEAVMTDFWLNHFNVYVRKNQQEAYLIPTYERETIRPRALGNFEDLLRATAMSPAMLEYLDNARSVGPNSLAVDRAKRREQNFRGEQQKKAADAGLNENYGRELMELHTLGVNGGYTQADVTNVAKVFTGWTIVPPNQGGNAFTFTFNENRHEPGAKTVLGQNIHEDGYNEGMKVIHMLATSPATAHFVCQKLAVRFVSDDPQPALVDRMAATFLGTHGDIKGVLRTMWTSPEFWSPQVYRAKVKTPEEFVVSAVRASGAEVTQPAALVQAIATLGMPLYGMQTPNGYSWKQDDWVNTGALVSRMNFAFVLSGDRIPGVQTEWTSLLHEGKPGMMPANYTVEGEDASKERRLEIDLVGQSVSEKTRAAVLGQANDTSVTEQAETQFDLRGGAGKGAGGYRQKGIAVAGNAAADDQQAAVMAGLLLGSPEFQRR
jgi:uncharacterized protein (DUF1800 family)